MVEKCVIAKKAKTPQLRKIKITRRFVEAVILLVVVVLILALPLFAGTKSYPLTVVEGNSMSPTLQNGDLVYYTSCGGKVENGSLIVFYQDNSGNPLLSDLTRSVVIHRVVNVTVGEDGLLYYKTKGDNNNVMDAGLIRFDSVLGVKALVIPKVGFAFLFLKSPQGLISLVSLVVISYLSIYESKLWKDKKKAAFLGQLAQKTLNKEVPEDFYRKVELAVQNIESLDHTKLEDADARALATWLKGSLGSDCKIHTVQCEKCHNRTVVLEGPKQTLLVGVSENGDCSGLVTLLKEKNRPLLTCENCFGMSHRATNFGLTQSVLKFKQMTL
ncbi:MAG: signal peptidase I [Candidatus Bathyarchaeota archaeon]|nr:signal peptidase I [Candidatus Bathyarchaeota archaeon]